MYIEEITKTGVLEKPVAETEVLVEFSEDDIRTLINRVKEDIGYYWVSYYAVNPKNGILEEIQLDEMGFNMIEAIRFQNGSGLAAWVASQQRPVLLGSVHKSQRFQSNPIKSFICCPIIRIGTTIGVISLGHTKTNAYNTRVLNKLNKIINPTN